MSNGENKVHGNGLYGRSSSPLSPEKYSTISEYLIRWTRLTSRGVPDERPIADLPIERPNFTLLYGSDDPNATLPMTMDPPEKAETGISRKRTTRGGEDIDITDKLTMTWVSLPLDLLALADHSSSGSRRPTSRLTSWQFSPTLLSHTELYHPALRQNGYVHPHVVLMSFVVWIWFSYRTSEWFPRAPTSPDPSATLTISIQRLFTSWGIVASGSFQ